MNHEDHLTTEETSPQLITPPTRPSRRAVISLAAAALVITALAVWRQSQEGKQLPVAPREVVPRSPAPRFQLYDQDNSWVKFERYVGRTKIVLVFFDSLSGADQDPVLPVLFRRHEEVRRAGWQVVAVSDAVPLSNRQAAERLGNLKSESGKPVTAKFPFPVLTDVDPSHSVYQLWGRVDSDTGRLMPGIFLIDRLGLVDINPLGPVSQAPEAALRAIFGD